jgi:hypothetical protein
VDRKRRPELQSGDDVLEVTFVDGYTITHRRGIVYESNIDGVYASEDFHTVQGFMSF